MKRIKNKRIKWLIIHEHYCQKSKYREKEVKKRQKKKKKKKKNFKILTAPKVMSLKNNFKEVVQFFNDLRELTANPDEGKRLTVDFENISTLMPGAALILSAELYRWQELNSIKLKPFKPYRWNDEVVRLFNQLGLFDLLQTSHKHKIKKSALPGPQTFFKFLTGNLSDGELAYRLMENMSPVIDSYYDEKLLYVALSEAMTNVIQHAYTEESDVFDTDLKNRWWLSGSFNSDNRVMTVLLFDQGVGIPATLPAQPFYHNILKFLDEKKDAIINPGRLIQAAVEVGRSRTGHGHRGKGLKQILRFSSDSDFGSLYIVSRKGEFFFNEDCTEEAKSCPAELGGTFIQWEIKLQKDSNNGKIHFKDCREIY